MGCIAHPLGHLLWRFELHIHITGSGLYGPDEPALGDLHRLHLAALRRQGFVLQRRLRTHHICNAARRHQRHIGCEHILDLSCRQLTPVQADLRHLTLLQSLKYLLCGLVLYCCTNHILVVLSGVTQSCRFMSHRLAFHMNLPHFRERRDMFQRFHVTPEFMPRVQPPPPLSCRGSQHRLLHAA